MPIATQRAYVGCSGWAIPRHFAGSFPLSGSQLERYARIFPAVEIASTATREHKPETFRRWSQQVPHDFRFAVKAPEALTHGGTLGEPNGDSLPRFLAGIAELEAKLGPVVLAPPASLPFDQRAADLFFEALRERFHGQVAFEPRHASWLSPAADALFTEFKIARVAADPPLSEEARAPGGCPDYAYWRLHGAPQLFYSPYDEPALKDFATELKKPTPPGEAWCIFDNTTVGYATDNALYMLRTMQQKREPGAAVSRQ